MSLSCSSPLFVLTAAVGGDNTCNDEAEVDEVETLLLLLLLLLRSDEEEVKKEAEMTRGGRKCGKTKLEGRGAEFTKLDVTNRRR